MEELNETGELRILLDDFPVRVRNFHSSKLIYKFFTLCKYALNNKAESPFIFYCFLHFFESILWLHGFLTQMVCHHSSIQYTCTTRNKMQHQIVQCVVATSLSPVSSVEEARTVLPTTSPLNSEPSSAQSATRMACNLAPSAMSTMTEDYSLISLVFVCRQ